MSKKKKSFTAFLFQNAAEGTLAIAAIEREYQEHYPLYLKEAQLYIDNKDIAQNAVHDMFVRALSLKEHRTDNPQDIQMELKNILQNVIKQYINEYQSFRIEHFNDHKQGTTSKSIAQENFDQSKDRIRDKMIFESGLTTKEQLALTCQITPHTKLGEIAMKQDIGPEHLESAIEKIKKNKDIESLYLHL